jgi:hypothetical protein
MIELEKDCMLEEILSESDTELQRDNALEIIEIDTDDEQ